MRIRQKYRSRAGHTTGSRRQQQPFLRQHLLRRLLMVSTNWLFVEVFVVLVSHDALPVLFGLSSPDTGWLLSSPLFPKLRSGKHEIVGRSLNPVPAGLNSIFKWPDSVGHVFVQTVGWNSLQLAVHQHGWHSCYQLNGNACVGAGEIEELNVFTAKANYGVRSPRPEKTGGAGLQLPGSGSNSDFAAFWLCDRSDPHHAG